MEHIDERWPSVLREAYEESAQASDAETFREKLAELARDHGVDERVVEEFTEYLDRESPAPHELHALIEQYEQPPQDGAGYDEAAWDAFLAENGPAFSGDEAHWTAFADWFRYEAAQRGLEEPAARFLDYVASQPSKAEVFAQYGIALPVESGHAEPEPARSSGPPLDPATFPLAHKLAALEANEAAVKAFLKAEYHLDIEAVVAELDEILKANAEIEEART